MTDMQSYIYLHKTKFLPVGLKDALDYITNIFPHKNGDYFCFSNIHVMIESCTDNEFQDIINEACANFPDGMGTALALKIIGCHFTGRVRGLDMMVALCKYAEEKHYRVFFYGSTQNTLKSLKKKIVGLFPKLIISGFYSPPFRETIVQEDDVVVQGINDADTDILFVSLGAPKQERWMAAHKGRIKALQFGVGAAFDFIAGNVKEAPKWMQNTALEWLYRFPQQRQKTIKRMLLVPEMWYILGKQLLLERVLKTRNYQDSGRK